MKIKTSGIEDFDIKSLAAIFEGVMQMKKNCENLHAFAETVSRNIAQAEADGYQDVNSEHAKEIIAEYRKKLEAAEQEFSELAVSVDQYGEKIDKMWKIWRRRS